MKSPAAMVFAVCVGIIIGALILAVSMLVCARADAGEQPLPRTGIVRTESCDTAQEAAIIALRDISHPAGGCWHSTQKNP
jgi:hypothetical protein